MPRMKVPDDEINLDELESAEYSDEDFGNYEGEQPPKGTILVGVVKKIWWTYTQNNDPMLKVLWEADGNIGSREKFNGCPVWDNIVLNAKGKFRWKPFLDALGLTLRDIKSNMVLASDDDNMGAPIEKIGKWSPDTDSAFCRVVTGRERYNDEWQVRVSKYLEYEDPEEEEEPEPEPEPEPPARSRRASRTTATAKPAATRSRRAAAKPEPEPEPEEDAEDDEDDELEEPEEEPQPVPATRTRGSRSTRTATAAPKPGRRAAPARGRRAAAEPDDEPPF
jgi:hypothetical protein